MLCRIGVIAQHNIPDTPPLNLGEYIGDKDDIQKLYGLCIELSYLYPFWGISKINGKCTDIIPTNIKDFIYLQDKYSLTKRIFIPKCVNTKVIRFKEPELYDISCNIQLFNKASPKPIIKYTPSAKETIIFIVPPYDNSTLRGQSIDMCIELYSNNLNHTALFILMGGIAKPNTIELWKLSQRYLIKRGVPNNAIISINNDKNIIKSIASIIPMITNKDDVFKVYMSVKSCEMHKYLLQCRQTSKTFKVFFIDF